MTRRLHWLLLACTLACGAGQPAPSARTPRYPVVLLPSDTLGAPFVVQQRLHGRYAGRDIAISVVVQLAQGKLTLIGLTPFFSRAFVLTQHGTRVRFEKFVDRELPFDPRYMLDDVHRVFFRGFAGTLPDGVHVREEYGERVVERWEQGRLAERKFERRGEPAGRAIVVRFEGAKGPVVARVVTIANGWFGYTLRIENVTQQHVAE